MSKAYGAAAVGAALTAAALFGAPASADDPAPRARQACAFVSQIDDFKHVDDYSAILSSSPNRRFRVTFANRCRELRWAQFARIDARPGPCLTPGDILIVGRHGFFDRCYIRTVEAMPPRGQAASAKPY